MCKNSRWLQGDDVLTTVGVDAVIAILVHLLLIVMTWWVLSAMPIEKLFRKGKTLQIQVFIIFLTIVIASIVSEFILTYLSYAKNLKYLFP